VQGRWSLSPKPEIKPPGLDFGHAVGKDSRGWCGEVVGRCVQGGDSGRVAGLRNERGVVDLGQNLETEPPGLDFGYAVGKDGGGPCEEVVGRCVRGGNGGRVAGSRNEREAVGLGQNIETEPPGLDFGHAIGKDGGGPCGEAVGRCVQGSNGGRVAGSETSGRWRV
jgi:hypothetical protein